MFEPPKHTIIIGLHGDFPCLKSLVKVNMFPFIWIYLGDVPFYSEESLWISSFLVGNIPALITRCVQVLTKLEASSAESWISGMGQVTCGRKNCRNNHLSDFDGLGWYNNVRHLICLELFLGFYAMLLQQLFIENRLRYSDIELWALADLNSNLLNLP